MILLACPPRLASTLLVVPADDRALDGVAVAGRLADGRWLVRAMSRPDVNRRGMQRIPGFAGLIGSGAAGAIEWLAEAPDLAVLVVPTGSQKMVNVVEAAFPPSFAVVASGSSIWFGDTAADTIVHVDVAAGARKTVKLPDPAPPIPADWVTAARTSELAAARNQAERALVEAKYSPPNLPTSLPAFESLVAAVEGELWVQAPAPSRGAPARYVVLSTGGSPIARVSVPAGFRVMDAGRDYVVGVHLDDDAVETVRVYALAR
jgi:hypothetical protein